MNKEIFVSSEQVNEFQYVCQENVTCDNIKSHRKTGLHPFSENYSPFLAILLAMVGT